MDITGDPKNILMSSALRDVLGPDPEALLESAMRVAGTPVDCVVFLIIDQKETSVIGLLKGIKLGTEHQIEVRVGIDDALGIIDAKGLSGLTRVEIAREDRSVTLSELCTVSSIWVDEIDTATSVCTLGICFVSQRKA